MTARVPVEPTRTGFAAATNVKRAGNSTEPAARVTTTRPSSSGWRSASSASRRNSVSSSRKRTPWCARETSPGRRNVDPPPSRPAIETEWCGARNGRDESTPRSRRSPATECSCVASSASSRESSGRIVGQPPREHRLARPRRPDHEQVVAPRRRDLQGSACLGACPRISERSTAAPSAGGAAPGSIAGGSPNREGTRDVRERGRADHPSGSICAASIALAAGTTTPRSPARAAAIATDKIPGVGRSSPFSDSSPANAKPSSAFAGTCAVAASTLTAIGRSSPGALLAQVPGREVHDHAPQRPLEPRVLDRRSDPVARVVHRRARKPGEDQRRQPSADERLHRHEMTADAEHRDPYHAPVHAERTLRGGSDIPLAASLRRAPERFDWQPGARAPRRHSAGASRAALENLGERTWREALDWLYDHAMTRPTAPDLYPETRAAYYGAPGGPGPAPTRGATSTEVLAEFRERLAPPPTTRSTRVRSATSRLRRCRCRSPARCSRNGSTRASTSGTPARWPRSWKKR